MFNKVVNGRNARRKRHGFTIGWNLLWISLWWRVWLMLSDEDARFVFWIANYHFPPSRPGQYKLHSLCANQNPENMVYTTSKDLRTAVFWKATDFLSPAAQNLTRQQGKIPSYTRTVAHAHTRKERKMPTYTHPIKRSTHTKKKQHKTHCTETCINLQKERCNFI